MKGKLPQSVRKFIRKEKSRMRREILDFKKQKESINELYKKFHQETENKKQKTEII